MTVACINQYRLGVITSRFGMVPRLHESRYDIGHIDKNESLFFSIEVWTPTVKEPHPIHPPPFKGGSLLLNEEKYRLVGL